MLLPKKLLPFPVGLLAVVTAQAAEVDGLKEAVQNTLEQMREKDLEGFLECWHPQAVLYTRDDLFAIDRGASQYDEWADIVEDFFARIVAADFRPVSVKYRVEGNIGIVWGGRRFALDRKLGGGSDFDSRLTAVFSRRSNGWKIINWPSSAIPQQNR